MGLVLRTGDIDSRYSDSSAMFEGAKVHRKLQKQMGENYRAEAALSLETEIGGIPVKLYGRADGIITDDDGSVTIDEIKTTTLSFEQIGEQREVHLGQAKCYAVMLLAGLEQPPPTVAVQLRYYHLETHKMKTELFEYTVGELDEFFERLKQKYGVWLQLEHDWRITRNSSIKAAGFPFPEYRKGQREMAVAVYRAIEKRKKLYVQAPTGIGKTLSSLFPSIKAMGEEKAEKLFYLTAKTVTRAVAEDAVRLMQDGGLRFRSLTLRAKDKSCPNSETICTPDYCDRAHGHFDRVNEALLDLIDNNDLITPDTVAAYAEKHRVCPHEFALDVALWCDLIICDYNHVFDPVSYLKRFFSDEGGSYVFLIDEAHNLSDRVREMYTSALRKSDFSKLKSALKDKRAISVKLKKSIGQITKRMLAMSRELESDGHKTRVDKEYDEELAKLALTFVAAAEEWLAESRRNPHPLQNDVLTLYFETLSFLGTAELYDWHYASILENFGRDVTFTLFCLDPSEIIGKKLGLAEASALFSATLTPLGFYREILGGGQEDLTLSLPSPFDRERLLLMAHAGVSTKYADREASVAPVAEALYTAISGKKGNYIAYFPSYEYLRKVFEAFANGHPQVKTAVQQSNMDDEARRAFLESFDAENAETLLGFCVMGGVFSEGIDLKGERLIGSIIVGVGLPKISLRQDLIREYFDEKNGRGYDFAYVYPGMNKVLQAAGRVIRSESDYGEVLLIDSRFATAKYKSLYPEYWSHMKILKEGRQLADLIHKFPCFS